MKGRKSNMSRISDLENHLRQTQNLLKKYEEQYRLSENPKEQERAKKEISELRRQIRLYQKEHTQLLGENLSPASHFTLDLPAQSAPIQVDSPNLLESTINDTHALVIGIGNYQKIRKLSKTTVDARDFYDLLVQRGYPGNRCTLLLDEKATKGAINHALDSLVREVKDDSTVIIFFSGHGAQRVGGFEPGEYLCPVEADWFKLRETAISNLELTTALRAIPAARLLVCLDACHSGGVGQVRDQGPELINGLSDTGYASLLTGKGRVLLASCQPNEVSWELAGMRNGLFSHYLLEGLRGNAVKSEGSVRIFDLFEYVSQKVPAHMEQHPLFKGEVDKNWIVLR